MATETTAKSPSLPTAGVARQVIFRPLSPSLRKFRLSECRKAVDPLRGAAPMNIPATPQYAYAYTRSIGHENTDAFENRGARVAAGFARPRSTERARRRHAVRAQRGGAVPGADRPCRSARVPPQHHAEPQHVQALT